MKHLNCHISVLCILLFFAGIVKSQNTTLKAMPENFSLINSKIVPPVNDWPCDATILVVNETCLFVEGTNVEATNSDEEIVTCDGDSEGDVWFQLTVPAGEFVIIETDNGPTVNDMGMQIYYGSCTDLNNYPSGCIADGSSYSDLMPGFAIVLAPAGTTIFLRLWEVNNDAFGDFSICAYSECIESTVPDGIVATDTILCDEGTVTLTIDNGSLGSMANWIWYEDECESTPISTDDNLVVSPDVSTTYYVQADGACFTTFCVHLRIEIASSPETPVIIVDDCQLTTYILNDATYTWYLNGEIISEETSHLLNVVESGNYSVLITSEDGCSVLSDVVFVDCDQLGIDPLLTAEFQIYPNPGNDILNIAVSGYSGELTVTLINVLGSEVEKREDYISSQNQIISLQVYSAPGIYFLKIGNNGSEQTFMVMLE